MIGVRRVLSLAAVCCASALALQAQGTATAGGDPHVVSPEVLPIEAFIPVDDMLLLPEQLALASTPEEARNRTQAHVIDYRLRLGAWDAGVIPYEIAAAFSAVERQRILDSLARWARVAPLTFVARTTQSAYLNITRDSALPNQASPCFSNVGQVRRGAVVRTNLGDTCSSSSHTVAHELGHALGLWHEHQRSDRDSYLTVDLTNVPDNARSNFSIMSGLPLIGPYDFGSIMHYRANAFAIDTSRPTIVPHAPFQSWAASMGTMPEPSGTDHEAVAFLYNAQLRESTIRTPTEAVRTRFDRAELLLVMERLHAFYMSRYGLQRPQGLSIGGKPDFLGIAQWIFDVYLAARSSGFSAEGGFDIVIAAITQSDEWRAKNPGRSSLTPASFRGVISFNRDEFLEVLNRLDRYYAAPDGLQRVDGLSIAGGPDFPGIAAWIFDIYLSERLVGTSPTAAWVLTENAIRNTDEWRRKH